MTAPSLTAFIQGVTSVDADELNTFEQTCDNFSQLRGFVGVPGNQVYVRGRNSIGDGGQGVFYWSSSSTGPDNNSTVIVPTGSSKGAWLLIAPSPSYPVTPEMFGAVGNGVTDDYPAFAAAMAYLEALPQGGVLSCGARNYAISAQINMTTNNLGLIGQGSGATQFIPLSNNMICVVLAASLCSVRGIGFINSNSKTGCTGLLLGATNPVQTTTLTITNNNYISDIQYLGLAFGRVMAPGPKITLPSPEDSECYFNCFISEKFKSCIRAIDYRLCTTSTGGGANANNTYNIDIEDELGLANSGIVITQGSSNNFYGGYIEGVLNAGPLGTPTAIRLLATGGGTSNNTANAFYGISGEANSRGLDNSALQTQLYGCFLGVTNLLTVVPSVWIDGDPTSNPIVLPGYVYQVGGSLSNFANGATLLFANTQLLTAQQGGVQEIPKITQTSSGGGAVDFLVFWPIIENAVYEVYAGGADVVGTQVSGNFRATYCEGPSGTFTLLDSGTGAYSVTAGSPDSFTVVLTRVNNNYITVTVTITKSAITFSCYAAIKNHFQLI